MGTGETVLYREPHNVNGQHVEINQIVTAITGQKSEDTLPVDAALLARIRDPKDNLTLGQVRKVRGELRVTDK